MHKIKDCPKYKWNMNDVCLKNCSKSAYYDSIWPIRINSIKFKCNGKHKYECNESYCTSDQRACNNIRKHRIQIKKCT